ncbi:MAG: WecB/TagA/CpsF family glycosyltransferase [Oscillatoria sp. PMC 1068.18]|nr:WecB/TagA/CpsF family glycosyltransferase [Oscillatoria sp. PMC 1076.18]MEC4987691.1 WecB/TagA/CpsF family glycosyltransferase [Oscillatoria sp. PMC 1068.18]
MISSITSISQAEYSNEPETLPILRVNLLERRITCITVEGIINVIQSACNRNKQIVVANYNVHSFNLSMQLPWFYEFLQSAEIAHCDGSGILKGLEFMGLRLPIQYRASYSKLMPELLDSCNQQSRSIFLLGSKPEIVAEAQEQLKQQYPNISVAGHHGYFDKANPQQNQEIIEEINRFQPNILIVGMGMPTQEKWIQQYRNQLEVNAILPGGAVIDRLAGIVPDCPTFIANLGLEWLYRLCREPKRLASRYLLGNPAFLFNVALAKFLEVSKLQVEEKTFPLI